MAFRLLLHQHTFTPEQLRQHAEGLLQDYTISADMAATAAPSEQEKVVLDFVKQWLNGQEDFVVHTSGSTGVPKPIVISRERMKASAQLTLQALGIEAGAPALLCIHANYIGGKMMLVRAMEGSLPLRVVEPVANPLLNLSSFQPHFAALVPLQVQAILADQESVAILNRMKAVIIGGAPVLPSLEEQLQEITAPLYSTYGMTETVSHIALRRLNGPARQDYFQVLPQIKIETDTRGCLVISGPVVEEPVVTNDVVEMVDEEKFRWLGRTDNIINSGGIKVQAERVEAVAAACLSSLGCSRLLMAGGLPDEKLGQKVVLLIEGAPLAEALFEQLQAQLRQQLPPYWSPKDILFLDAFVKSDNGKIKRNESWAKL